MLQDKQLCNTVPLENLCLVITKGTTPTTVGHSFQEEGINFVKIESIDEDGRFLPWKFAMIDEKTHQTLKRSILQTGDLLFSIAGAIGRTAIVKENILPANTNQAIAIIRVNSKCVERKWLYYYLRSEEFQNFSIGRVVQTAQANVSLGVLKAAPIPLPPIPTQHKIASILSAYDDLIENNTKRIKILEEMAQTIYNEWFVKFRFPGHENVKMVDSELGMIPKGWEVKRIEDVYNTSSGGTPSRKVSEYYDGSINWVKTKELNDSYIFETEEKITQLGLDKSSAKVFPENTVIMAMYGATIGKLGILTYPSTTNQACCAILKKDDSYTHLYAYLYLLTNRTEIMSLGMGAAQQNISQQVIKKLQILVPPKDIILQFNILALSLFESLKLLNLKNVNLRTTRDLLLPRLISGEIDVSELDINVEEITA